MKQATTILIAAGALLVGGIATAAFMNNRDRQPDSVLATPADAALAADDAAPGEAGRRQNAPPTPSTRCSDETDSVGAHETPPAPPMTPSAR